MKVLLIALVGLCATKADQGDSVREANTEFANAFTKFIPRGGLENTVFSPFSAHVALSMLYQGAAGSTERQMAAVLHLPEREETAKAYQTVLNDLNGDNQHISVKVANQIFVRPGDPLKPEFTNDLKTYFDSDVQTVNFTQNAKAAQQINTWVDNNTNNKFHALDYKLVQPTDISDYTHIVLLNAFNVKGNWLNPFDKRLTKWGLFHVDENFSISTQMMKTSGKFVYKRDEQYGAEIIAMPLQNTNYSFYIILPTEKYGASDVLENLESGFALLAGARQTHLELTFPKMQLIETVDMKDVLTKMGLSEIFERGTCDLIDMFENGEDIYVSKAIQMNYLDIDEAGFEALAASDNVVYRETLPEVTVNVDHPFLFAIGHIIPNTSKLADVLLIGKIVNPAYFHGRNHNDADL